MCLTELKIILASGSPRRCELLKSLGLDFEIIKPDVDESILKNELPEKLCVRLAELKAGAIASVHKNSLVIAADTVVVIDDKILGKPKNRDEAFSMLKILQGREHRVLTGIALALNGNLISDFESSSVKFRPLSDNEIRAYILTGESDDKAGAYAIQGKGALLVEQINGDYFNVVGLPLCKLGFMLEKFDISLTKVLNV